MRVMVIIKANEHSENGVMPSEQLLTEMGKFNQELVDSGIMLAGDGLHPSARGKRVILGGEKASVVDGPFAETKELIAGFWIWEVESMDHAVELVKRIPNPPEEQVSGNEGIIEIRPIFEADDFGEEFTPEERAREDQMRATMAERRSS
ncbi:MAG: YciI family protein [Sphaerobacteraceae bacterium]|nr:MAG: YciI family protein [Sphaerobacteraceae bacterium]